MTLPRAIGAFCSSVAKRLGIHEMLVSAFISVREFYRVFLFLPNNSGFSPMNVSLFRKFAVSRVMRRIRSAGGRSHRADLSRHAHSLEGIPREVAEECFKLRGIYPISFSWPGEWVSKPKLRFLANIIPGQPYSYESFSDYLNHYAESQFAITSKKGGWDCFRHLEILASGGTPLMPDVKHIPTYTMTHYPKRQLEISWESFIRGEPYVIDDSMSLANVLSSAAMAKYLLDKLGHIDGKLLFIDEELPDQADYLSVLSLIGLKQVLGKRVEVAFPVPYVYADFAGDTSKLYGRGFGYTRHLPSKLKTPREGSFLETDGEEMELNFDDFETIVVGDFSRNRSLVTTRLMGHLNRCALLRGDDMAPYGQSLREIKELSILGATFFSREIY